MTGVAPTLGRKQTSSHDDWLRTFEKIKADPDHARAERLVQESADRVRERLRRVRRAAFGWSGGKDSLALEVVARAAGLEDCVLVISGLEYPAFLSWVTDHMPWGLTVECRSHLNYRWLVAHPEMLFPQDAATASKWFAQVQHAGQREYAGRARTEVLLLGRRIADGNRMGPRTDLGHEYRDRSGFDRYSPIGDWSHEDVLHVLAAYGVGLPPCYGWPRGFRVGTGPWPARQWTGSRDVGWDEVWEIDPSLPTVAARWRVPGAREVLARRTQRGD